MRKKLRVLIHTMTTTILRAAWWIRRTRTWAFFPHVRRVRRPMISHSAVASTRRSPAQSYGEHASVRRSRFFGRGWAITLAWLPSARRWCH